MKNSITMLIILLTTFGVFSQEQKEQQSKMLDFVSKTGVIIKFEDYKLPNIKSRYGEISVTEVRKISSGNEERLFFRISSKNSVASIAYEDLLEVQKALINLKKLSEKDLVTVSDYLENKFVTEDGFQVGYYISKGKIVWYMVLEKYGSDNSVFVKDYETLNGTFQEGKEKIEELKK